MNRDYRTWLLAGVCAAALLGGCGESKTSPGSRGTGRGADSSAGTARAEWVAKRPETRVDSIRIEGRLQQVDLKLFDQSFPFSTYYTDKEMSAETTSSPIARSARFMANFNGKLDRSAYLEISIPTSNLSLADLKHLLLDPNGFVQQSGWKMVSGRVATGDICPWADEFYFFTTVEGKEHISVSLCVGRHKDRAFFVVMHVPDALADGFAPRADLIQREFRWLDDGTRLVKE